MGCLTKSCRSRPSEPAAINVVTLSVQPQVPAGGACDDGTACTVNDVCAADGTCSGAPSDAACEDNIVCTTNTCSPGDATADVSGCTISYDNSACADNIACTDDVCVGGRDAAPLGIQPGDNFNNGCGYTATANPANACKYEQPHLPSFHTAACMGTDSILWHDISARHHPGITGHPTMTSALGDRACI